MFGGRQMIKPWCVIWRQTVDQYTWQPTTQTKLRCAKTWCSACQTPLSFALWCATILWQRHKWEPSRAARSTSRAASSHSTRNATARISTNNLWHSYIYGTILKTINDALWEKQSTSGGEIMGVALRISEKKNENFIYYFAFGCGNYLLSIQWCIIWTWSRSKT